MDFDPDKTGTVVIMWRRPVDDARNESPQSARGRYIWCAHGVLIADCIKCARRR